MKESKDNKCELHNLPFAKIQKHSKRLLCEKCMSEGDDERRQRLEMQRIRLGRVYQIELAELKEVKKQTDRLLELFNSRNLSEAKKIINKSSPDIQKIVESTIEKQMKEANKQLRERSEELLEKWKGIDGRSFTPGYIQFQAEIEGIDKKLDEFRGELKRQIGERLKVEVRRFYIDLFEL